MFELLDEVMSSGKPFLLARRYTLTSDPMGSLRQDLEGWFGKTLTDEALAQINLTQLLGAVAQITVKHETRGDRTYANIVSLSPPTRGTPQRAEATTGFLAFSLSEPFAAAEYAALPQWVQTTIAQSPECRQARGGLSGAEQLERFKAQARAQIAVPAPAPAPAQPATPVADDLDDELPF
jgi:hypothetical protein